MFLVVKKVAIFAGEKILNSLPLLPIYESYATTMKKSDVGTCSQCSQCYWVKIAK